MLQNSKGNSAFELAILCTMTMVLLAMMGTQLMASGFQSANAAAAADCRNAASAEQAFHADWGVYASSAAAAVPGMGQVLIETANSTGLIPQNAIDGTTAPSSAIPAPGFQIQISQFVGIVINTSAQGGSFTIGCKNAGGDRCFGMDSDARELFWVNGNIGAGLTVASAPVAVAGANDFTPGGVGVAGSGVCNGNPAGTGQVEWVAL